MDLLAEVQLVDHTARLVAGIHLVAECIREAGYTEEDPADIVVARPEDPAVAVPAQ